MARGIEELVGEMVLLLLDGTGLELVDVEYVKEKDWYLRIFIDKPEGISIDDCQELSGKIEAELDRRDMIPESYILEVSSPGLDRVLRKDQDFVREKGKMVDVSFYKPVDGEKMICGRLIGREDGRLLLEEHEPLPVELIAQVRLHIDI